MPPLVFLGSEFLFCSFPAYNGESFATLACYLFSFGKALIAYVIEILAFFLIQKFLSKKINDYQLVSVICIASFLIIIIIGGFNGFLLNVAYSLKNVSFCSMITNVHIKDTCIQYVAQKTDNELLCENLTLEQKNSCYMSFAYRRKDSTFCEKIEETDLPAMRIFWVETCYSRLAEITKDPNLCEKIETLETKDYCYYYVAEEAGKLDICEKILDPNLRRKCYKTP